MPAPQVIVQPAPIVLIKPERPLPLAPPEIEIKTITKDTVTKLLEEHPTYMCTSFEDYLSNGTFEKEKLAYIKQLLRILEFYERQLGESDEKTASPH